MSDDLPPLPDNSIAAGRLIDRRLEQTDDDLAESRREIEVLRASLDASLAGDHERAAALLDELDDRPGRGEGR